MESVNKEKKKDPIDKTNHSVNNEMKNHADSTKNNEATKIELVEKPKMLDLDQDDEKIKLVFDDDDDEDIPGDFFDDFLKEDFMAGLDIVDDDDWNEEDKAESALKLNHKPPPKEIPEKSQKKGIPEKSKKKEVIRKSKKKEESAVKNKRSIEAESNDVDARRDPKKTRRDIERDKERCEKDKEKKIISEKLQFVKTGLVPPGMEMEIDMDEIKKQTKELDQQVKSPVKTLKKSPKRNTSPIVKDVKVSKRISPRGKRSPFRKTSPVPKTSPRARPALLPTPSPLLKIAREERPTRRSPYYKRPRYSPPTTDRRRSSPRRRSSDRRRSPARDSYSRRRRSRSRSPKRRREEKKSFLQEIAEKLNETRPVMMQPMMMGQMPHQMMQPYHHDMHFMPEPMQMQPNQMMPPNHMMHAPMPAAAPVMPGPVPAPVPAPPVVNMYKPEQVYDPFDQSFFIGGQMNPVQQIPAENSQLSNAALKPTTAFASNPALATAPKPTTAFASKPNISVAPKLATNVVLDKAKPAPSSSPIKTNIELSELTKTIIDKLNNTTDNIPKLFQDNKISLSEFLAITAKPEVIASSPANLKEKIKVIARCQDAITYLGTSDKKFNGRLTIRKMKKKPTANESDKFRSPLLTKQQKIHFTEIPSRHENQSCFSSYINRLLRHIGIMDGVAVDLDKEEVDETPVEDETPPAPPPPPQISRSKRSTHERAGSDSGRRKELKKMERAALRAENSRCVECERRAQKTFKSSSTQCSQESVKYSVSTQFPEEDTKFPKSQSLAALTPAQLLAKSIPTTSRFKDEFDLYGRGRGMPPNQSNDLNFRPRYQPFF